MNPPINSASPKKAIRLSPQGNPSGVETETAFLLWYQEEMKQAATRSYDLAKFLLDLSVKFITAFLAIATLVRGINPSSIRFTPLIISFGAQLIAVGLCLAYLAPSTLDIAICGVFEARKRKYDSAWEVIIAWGGLQVLSLIFYWFGVLSK